MPTNEKILYIEYPGKSTDLIGPFQLNGPIYCD